MAIEACFQVSTIASATTPTATRASVLHSQHPFPHKEKLINLQSNRGSKTTISSSSSPSLASLPTIRRSSRLTGRFICEAKNVVDEVLAVNEGSWDNMVIGSETPALVEFWAPWCGPCRMIAPVIDELAKEYAGKITCFKVNTDESPNIATKYGIRSIPTVLVFKNGEKKESVIGAVPKSTLSDTIEKYVEA